VKDELFAQIIIGIISLSGVGYWLYNRIFERRSVQKIAQFIVDNSPEKLGEKIDKVDEDLKEHAQNSALMQKMALENLTILTNSVGSLGDRLKNLEAQTLNHEKRLNQLEKGDS